MLIIILYKQQGKINARDKKVINLKYRINRLDTRDDLYLKRLITRKIFGTITLKEEVKALIINDKKIINYENILLKL